MHNLPKRHSTLTRNPPKRHQPSTCNPPNDINRFMRNLLKRNRRGGACVPARTFAQRRFHTKTHALCAGNLTMDAPLLGDTGGQRRFHTNVFIYKTTIHLI